MTGPGTVLIFSAAGARVVEYPDSGKVGVAAAQDFRTGDASTTGRASERAVVNLYDVARAATRATRPAMRRHTRGIGPLVGGTALGMSVYELAEGRSICPYHYEYRRGVAARSRGQADAARSGGRARLAPGDVVCFPAGPEGAHKITNRARSPRCVAILSTKASPSVAVYPDSGKIGVWSGDGEVKHLFPLFRRRRLLDRRV